MRPALNLIASMLLVLASALSIGPAGEESPVVDDLVRTYPLALGIAVPKGQPPVVPTFSPGFDLKPIGLSLLRPYMRGKIPVVFIHGLGATPQSWARMIDGLETDPIIRSHYQFWTFGYATGEPILYSASLLRRALVETRDRYDQERSDPAFDRMVLVGHSMGGILAKVMAENSRSVLWDKISTRPVEKLLGPPEAREVLRQSFFFKAVPEVSRIVYIATPHRGSGVDQGPLRWLALLLNQPLDALRKLHESLLASNDPEFFHQSFREGLPSSVDQLAWQHPILLTLFDLVFNPGVKFHSIIADINDHPGARGTDGVVPYASSHVVGASSELIVQGGHLCQAEPLVIRECQRILKEHLASRAVDPARHRWATRVDASRRLSVREPDSGQPARSSRSPVSARGGDPAAGAQAPTVAR